MARVSIPKLHKIKFKSGIFAENVEYAEKFTIAKNIPSINVLEGAILADLRDVVLIGYTKDGYEYIASSIANKNECSYLFGRGQLEMLRQGDV